MASRSLDDLLPVVAAKARAHIAACKAEGIDGLMSRFFAKVEPDLNSGCHLWSGAVRGNGYGSFKFNGMTGSRAHRVAWVLAHGEIPAGMHVLHRCDTPACVNPAHLFLGTHDANMADKMSKGRHRPMRGEANGSARLTAADVSEIRKLAAEGVPQREIGNRFGVTHTNVGYIVRRQNWASVA